MSMKSDFAAFKYSEIPVSKRKKRTEDENRKQTYWFCVKPRSLHHTSDWTTAIKYWNSAESYERWLPKGHRSSDSLMPQLDNELNHTLRTSHTSPESLIFIWTDDKLTTCHTYLWYSGLVFATRNERIQVSCFLWIMRPSSLTLYHSTENNCSVSMYVVWSESIFSPWDPIIIRSIQFSCCCVACSMSTHENIFFALYLMTFSPRLRNVCSWEGRRQETLYLGAVGSYQNFFV